MQCERYLQTLVFFIVLNSVRNKRSCSFYLQRILSAAATNECGSPNQATQEVEILTQQPLILAAKQSENVADTPKSGLKVPVSVNGALRSSTAALLEESKRSREANHETQSGTSASEQESDLDTSNAEVNN